MVELSMFCGYTHTYWHCGLPCLNSLCCLEMDGTEGRCLHWCRNCSEAPNCCAPLTLLSSLHHRTRGLLVSTKGLQKGLQSRAQNKRFACVNKGFTKGVTKQSTEQKVCLCQRRFYKRGYKAEHRTRGLLVSTKGLQKGLQSRAQNKRFACVNKGFTKGVTKQNTEQEVCLCQQRVYKRGYKAEHRTTGLLVST